MKNEVNRASIGAKKTKRFNNVKWLLVVALAVMSIQLWATDVTFVAGTDNGTTGKSGITFTASDNSGNPYKVYKGTDLVITAPTGYNITQIVFTSTNKGTEKYSLNGFGDGAPATWSYDNTANEYTGTWTGSAGTVTFNATDNQVRISRMVITIGASTTYAVTWKSDGTTVHTDASVPSGTTVTAPSAPSVPSGCTGAVFMGWTATENYSANTAPADLFTTTSPSITAATTFYAVFADPE